jgi:gas vesicle protein
MNNTAKILAAFAIGAAAGAIAGILLAPDKGSETRRKLSEEGKKLAEGLKKQCCKTTDNLKEEMEEAGNGFA